MVYLIISFDGGKTPNFLPLISFLRDLGSHPYPYTVKWAPKIAIKKKGGDRNNGTVGKVLAWLAANLV